MLCKSGSSVPRRRVWTRQPECSVVRDCAAERVAPHWDPTAALEFDVVVEVFAGTGDAGAGGASAADLDGGLRWLNGLRWMRGVVERAGLLEREDMRARAMVGPRKKWSGRARGAKWTWSTTAARRNRTC
jgi:hypothetical protein